MKSELKNTKFFFCFFQFNLTANIDINLRFIVLRYSIVKCFSGLYRVKQKKDKKTNDTMLLFFRSIYNNS